MFWKKNNGSVPAGQRRYFYFRITVFRRRQYLTIYIKNVIISVTMITKKLFVTRRAKMALESVLPRGDIKSH